MSTNDDSCLNFLSFCGPEPEFTLLYCGDKANRFLEA